MPDRLSSVLPELTQQTQTALHVPANGTKICLSIGLGNAFIAR